MKKALFPSLFALALSSFCVPALVGAPAKDVYPVPQLVKPSGSQSIAANQLAGSAKKFAPIAEVCKAKKINPAGAVAIVVEKDGATLKARLKAAKVEPCAGAYWLNVTPKEIKISAADGSGVFYAAQTIAQMIELDGKIACGQVLDWPDVPFRGSVEGFYGRVWTHEARLSQIRFYGKYKMNAYIYGPKDDLYHKDRWREAYPAEEAKKLQELAEVSRENHVDFIWAIHLGASFNQANKEEEYRLMEEKFENMYKLGVRAFAIFFDDFGGADGKFHAEACNRATAWLKKKGDCAPLVLCPNQYNRAWSGGDYLDILGNELDPSVNVMWTGNSVCHDITAEGQDWINNRIKRKAYIWWNWPVVDYCASALLLGRTYGLAKENKGKYSGFVSNPMDKPEASKIALFGVGDYCWNIDAFNSEKSWKDGIRRLYPDYAEAMQVLANHSSDQGPNGHGYRREESVEFKPVLEKAAQEIAAGKLSKDTEKQLLSEFKKMKKASKELIAKIPEDNADLWLEIEFWVRTLGETGNLGGAVTKLAAESDVKKRLDYAQKAAKYYDARERMMAAQADHADKIGAPHKNPSKVAAREVAPFLTKVFQDEWAKLVKQLGAQATSASSGEALFKVISDVPAMKNDIAVRDKKYVRIRKFEQVTLKPGQYIGIELPEGIYGNYIHLKLENPDASKSGKVEVSKDGKSWEAFGTRNNGQELQNNLDVNRKIRFFRYVNTSGKDLGIKLNEFKFDIPEDAKANSRGAMTDGDPRSGYETAQAMTIPAEKGVRKTYVISSNPSRVSVAPDGKIQVTPEKNKPVTIFEIVRVK